MLQSNNEIQEKELNYWLYDWNFLKCSENIRKKIKDIDKQKLVQNINEEMSHKSISREEKCLMVNADVYLLASGQSTYFFEIKTKLEIEIKRLNSLYEKSYYKKKEWKQKCKDDEALHMNACKKLEKELEYYKIKVLYNLLRNIVKNMIFPAKLKSIIFN